MAGAFQGISPEVIELILELAGAGRSSTPFGRFAQNIKQLSGVVGGDKTQTNIEQGLTGRSATPVAPAPRPSAPMMPPATPSPTGNTGSSIIPLLAIGQGLSLLKSGVTAPASGGLINNPAVAPAGSTLSAAPSVSLGPPAPGPAAAPVAAAGPAPAAASSPSAAAILGSLGYSLPSSTTGTAAQYMNFLPPQPGNLAQYMVTAPPTGIFHSIARGLGLVWP